MKSIENQAMQTYQGNISYFSKYFPELFKKLELFNAAINSGQYVEKYALEYKEGYFDIIDIKNNTFMYGKNSDRISKNIAKKTTNKKNESVIESFYHEYSNISKDAAQEINDNVKLHDNPLMATSNIISYTSKMAPINTTSIMRIFKYIFFGVGTGKHLELIQRKFKFKQVLIVEKSLELFRLSLFTLNYEKTFKDVRIFFSIAENINDFNITFSQYFRKGFSHNHFLKYCLFSESYIDYIKEIQSEIVSADYIAFPYSKKLVISLTSPYFLVHKYSFLNLSKCLDNTPFSKKPILIVAAGPSFANNIEWLKENKNRFTIVSILASLKTLHQHDIKPDILVNLDSSPDMRIYFETINISTFLSNTIFIFASMSHKLVVDMLPKDRLYLFDSMSSHKKDFGQIVAPSVGELSYSLFLLFDTKEIYLLGLDLALDAETKERYSDKEHFANITHEEKSLHSMQLEKTMFTVKGNFLDSVPTLPIFKLSITAFAKISSEAKKETQKVYNLGNGAKLDGSIPLHIENIDKNSLPYLDKNTEYFEELQRFFIQNSENIPNKNDINYLETLIIAAQHLLDTLEDYRNNKILNTIDDNMIELGKLIDKLQGKNEEKLTDLHVILLKYNQFVTSYIIAFFNTNEIQNHIEHFKYINMTYVQQAEKIITVFMNTIKDYKTIADYEYSKSKQ